MTTIKLKNGSGAPAGGDLTQGEPALDLTNKRLYTENASGTVIEVGTNPGVDVTFADNRKAIFGAGSDLSVYHDGSNSYIDENGVGNLFIRSVNGASARIYSGGTASSNLRLLANSGGEITLYHSGSAKLATSSSGIDVTGTVTADGLTAEGELIVTGGGTGTILVNNEDSSLCPTMTFTRNGGGTITNDFIKFENSGGEVAAINSTGGGYFSGNVGIGTSSTPNKLTVLESSADFAALIQNSLTSGNGLKIQAGDNSGDRILQLDDKDGNEKLRVTALGNVGIGTTVVDSLLHLQKSDATAYSSTATDSQVGVGPTIYLENPANANSTVGGQIVFGMRSTEEQARIGATGGSAPALTFGTADAERMRIDASGNVGIGTDTLTDSYKTIIEGSDQETANLTDSGTHGATLFLRATGENVGSGGAVAFGTTNGNQRPFAAIKSYVNDGTANSVGDLAFSTRATTSATNLTERMRLHYNGRLDLGGNSPQAKLDVQSDGQYTPAAYFRNDGNAIGWARADWYNDNVASTGIIYRDQAGSFVMRNDNATGTAMGTYIIAGNTTAGSIIFNNTTTSEAGRFDASGNLLVGKTGLDVGTAGLELRNDGLLAATRSGSNVAVFRRLSDDGSIVDFQKDGTTVGSIGATSGDLIIGTGDTGLRFTDGASSIVPADPSSGGNADDLLNLGFSTVRFDNIYATNGTIQTSDRNEKQDIEELSEAEQRVAVAAKGLLRKFRWVSRVETKGDDARIHFGIIAQDLQDAFTAEGLDAGRYGMFINSTWTDEETGEERSRMGVRYSELLAFIISAI